jgi:4-diphosphocytidyl-2-C-methyl-D-erythritol kinase
MLKSEFAPAKINLTLEVLGRRPDGYHEIRSLVAFAQDVGDRIAFGSGRFTSTAATGPFADEIAGANLVDKAVAAIAVAASGVEPEQLILEKNLPVASGIGGGSADAAAALRLMHRTYPGVAGVDLPAVAQTLGADVPVCLKSRAAMMTGIGEHIENVELSGDLFAVLVNPLASVPKNKTAQVFALLAASPLAGNRPKEEPLAFSGVNDVIAYAAARGNALESPARQLFPMIGTLLSELGGLRDSRLVQLSGAGPTCFALFETEGAAASGAAELQGRNPNWWIRSTRLA